MAEIWVAAGATVVAGYMGSQAAKKGAEGQAGAAAQATAESARQFDQTRRDNMPWLEAGTNALNLQNQYLQGDTSGFANSPDYAFAVQQGFQGLNNGSRGNLWGGGLDADRMALGQGLATQYAGNYWNKLAGMAGQGQQTGQYLGQMGANFANQAGDNAMNAANARASSYGATANAWGSALNAGVGAWNQYRGQQAASMPQAQGWSGGAVPQSQWGAGVTAQQPWYGNNYGNFS